MYSAHLYFNHKFFGPSMSSPRIGMLALLIFQPAGSIFLHTTYLLKRARYIGQEVERYKMKKILQLADVLKKTLRTFPNPHLFLVVVPTRTIQRDLWSCYCFCYSTWCSLWQVHTPLLLYQFNTCPAFTSTPNSKIVCNGNLVGSNCTLACSPLYWSSSSLYSSCTWWGVWTVKDFIYRPQAAALAGVATNKTLEKWKPVTEIYPPNSWISNNRW